jgi:hypothetical protein
MTAPARGAALGWLTSRLLLRLAGRIVPEVARAPPAARRIFVDTVASVLSQRPTLQRLEFRALVLGLGIVTAVLPAAWQDAVLRWFESAPLTVLRVGLWGLKTFVFMGYYSQPDVIAGIHYKPSKRHGNDILHGASLDGGA